MSDVISLTAAMRSNLLSLQKTDSQIGILQNRLATGKKVNSALDDPTAFFAAQGLSGRASDLTALIDSMGQAVQTLKAVDQTITSMSKMLAQAKAIAQTANTKLGGNSSITGTHSFTAAEMADLETVTGWETDDTLGISVAGEAAVEIATDGADMQSFIQAINGNATLNGRVKAELVANTAPGREGEFFLKISTTGGETLQLEENAGTVAADYGLSTALVGSSPSTTVEEGQYDAILAQFDMLVADGGYRGVNLLQGSNLTVQFDEENVSKITITGVSASYADLSISAADFASGANIDKAIAEIDKAVETLKGYASDFGTRLSIIQTRQDFTKELINTLIEGSDKLTLADKNEEGAKLLALQTSQALGIQALALASQSNQSVLRLFQ